MQLPSPLQQILARIAPAKTAKGEGAKPAAVPASVIKYFLAALGGIAILLLIAVGAAAAIWVEGQNAVRRQQLERSVGLLARDLRNRTASLQGALREWAVDPQIQGAYQTPKGGNEMHSLEERLTRATPDALRVRLLPALSADSRESPPKDLSFAGLHQAIQATTQNRVTNLETHRLGQPDAHLAIAGPVLDGTGAKVIGAIHVALPLSVLRTVSSAIAEDAQVAFGQTVGKEVVPVDKSAHAIFDGTPGHKADVPGTTLVAVGRMAPVGLFDGELPLVAGGVYLAILAAIAALLLVLGNLMRGQLRQDLMDIVGLVEDGLSRVPLRRAKPRLGETAAALDMVRLLVADLEILSAAGLGAPRPPRESKAQPQQEEPIEIPAPGRTLATEPAPAATPRPEPASAPVPVPAEDSVMAQSDIGSWVKGDGTPLEIFRAYDIRGIVERDLPSDLVYDLGLSIGTEAKEEGDDLVYVGRDTRPSSQDLADALIAGLRASGCDVVNLGMVPTPLVYFATRFRGECSGVMVTASHNPAEYNGFKVVIHGETLEGERIKGLRDRMMDREFAMGDGDYREVDLMAEYIEQVQHNVAIARPLKIVVDAGNATASLPAPALYRSLGCDVIELDCDPFSGMRDTEMPDPTRPGALDTLRDTVMSSGADLGIGFDVDGDRIGIVDSSGKVITADRLLMLLAEDVLSRHPGTDVVFDVKCTHHLPVEILRHGGRPVMWKSGHSRLKAKVKETGAMLGGEWSGHIVFQERWLGFDDALYAGARLLEVLALDPRPSDEIFLNLPKAKGTPEIVVPLAEGEAEHVMRGVVESADRLVGVDVQTIDGLRAEFDQGWGLVRASNTRPALTFRFEGNNDEALTKIKTLFRRLMESVAPDIQMPF